MRVVTTFRAVGGATVGPGATHRRTAATPIGVGPTHRGDGNSAVAFHSFPADKIECDLARGERSSRESVFTAPAEFWQASAGQIRGDFRDRQAFVLPERRYSARNHAESRQGSAGTHGQPSIQTQRIRIAILANFAVTASAPRPGRRRASHRAAIGSHCAERGSHRGEIGRRLNEAANCVLSWLEPRCFFRGSV